MPIFKASQVAREVISTVQLHALSQEIFDSHKPSEVLYKNDQTQSLEKVDGKYILRLHMPNVEIDKLNVNIKGDELLVDINNFRKSIVLPNILVGRKTEGADFDSGHLNITFSGT